MARITVEDCLDKIPNRFELVLLSSKRAKQLLKGARPLVETDNKDIVTSLREVAPAQLAPLHLQPTELDVLLEHRDRTVADLDLFVLRGERVLFEPLAEFSP